MLSPWWSSLWAILGVLLIRAVPGTQGDCRDRCRAMAKGVEEKEMECLWSCRIGFSSESPMQPLSEKILKSFLWNQLGKSNSNGNSLGYRREEPSSDSSAELISASSQAPGYQGGDSESHPNPHEKQVGKRSYAMEHFRWGRPVGLKRRPIKANSNGIEEESSESDRQEFRRDESDPQEFDLSYEMDYPELDSPLERQTGEAGRPDEKERLWKAKKLLKANKMPRFRWNALPSLPKKKRYGGFMTAERSHTPLVTLFKNAIVKTAYKKGH